MQHQGELIVQLALKSLRVKYKNSLLGILWSLLHPLVYLVIFSCIFSQVFSDIKQYPLFALIGLLCWTFFNNCVQQTMNAVLQNGSVIRSLRIPIYIFPLSACLSEGMGMLLILFPATAIMLYLGAILQLKFILFLLCLLLLGLFSFGLGLILCTYNVFFRDVSILWNTLAPALFYLTPIAYSIDILPVRYRVFMHFNPLFHFIDVARTILYSQRYPDLKQWTALYLFASVSLILGTYIFKKYQHGFISAV
jgi:ABC-type polysaccharide/polyol phosphate export permease